MKKIISNIIFLNLLVVFSLFAQEARTTIIANNGMTLEKTETGSPVLHQKAMEKLYVRFNGNKISKNILLDRYTLNSRIDKLSYKGYSVKVL